MVTVLSCKNIFIESVPCFKIKQKMVFFCSRFAGLDLAPNLRDQSRARPGPGLNLAPGLAPNLARARDQDPNLDPSPAPNPDPSLVPNRDPSPVLDLDPDQNLARDQQVAPNLDRDPVPSLDLQNRAQEVVRDQNQARVEAAAAPNLEVRLTKLNKFCFLNFLFWEICKFVKLTGKYYCTCVQLNVFHSRMFFGISEWSSCLSCRIATREGVKTSLDVLVLAFRKHFRRSLSVSTAQVHSLDPRYLCP